MKRKRVVDLVADIAQPFLAQHGLEFVDVEFVKEGPFRYLRVMIDRNEGVSLDDCSLVSKFLNKELDRLDPIEENYFLEVTSPGVERELTREKDFVRYQDHKVQANLFAPIDGQKVVVGLLKSMVNEELTIEREDGKNIVIPMSKVSLVKLVVDFE